MPEISCGFERCSGCGEVREVATLQNNLASVNICNDCVADAAIAIGCLEQRCLEFDIIAESRLCQS